MLKNGPRGWMRAVPGSAKREGGMDGREGMLECNTSLMIFIGSELSFPAGTADAGWPSPPM